jgi:Spy/CpxP family protein refolding chaperone
MTKKILIGVGALAVVIAAGAAWAQGPGRGFMMKQMISNRVAEAEDLIKATPEQRAQIEKSRDTILAALQAGRAERRDLHAQLVALLMRDDPLKAEDLSPLVTQHTDEVNKLAQTIVPEIVAVHNILTHDQRATLAAKAKELRQKHHQQKGGFGGPGE